MERVGAILHHTHRELIVSKRTLEKAKGVELVRIKREQASTEVTTAFTHLFCLSNRTDLRMR